MMRAACCGIMKRPNLHECWVTWAIEIHFRLKRWGVRRNGPCPKASGPKETLARWEKPLGVDFDSPASSADFSTARDLVAGGFFSQGNRSTGILFGYFAEHR